ncbi:MAG TPA: FtsX-like permease family protein [Planctomycetes bacterium]|nr:FtsX-like permease family protein [Planctomycetota bacterium]
MYKLALALRYLLRRRIAYVSIIAIAFGVMAMFVVGSVMDGFQKRIRQSIYKVDGHLSVRLRRDDLVRSEDHFRRVQEMLRPWTREEGGPIVAMEPRIVLRMAGIVTRAPKPWITRDKRQKFVQVFGVDPDRVNDVIPFREMIESVRNIEVGDGTATLRLRMPDRLLKTPFLWKQEGADSEPELGIVLGSRLADRLDVGVGDTVTLMSAELPPDDVDPSEVKIVQRRFHVTGCFESGRFEYDSGIAFCHIQDLKEWLRGPNEGACDEVRVRLTDPTLAEKVKAEILEKHGRGFLALRVWTWQDRMKNLAAALKFEKLAMLIVLACIIAVAGACIAGILYMVVLEKTRDIGVLLSMGATSRGVVGIFLTYGGLLGLIGTLLGVFLGLEVVWHLDEIIRFLERLFDIDLFPPDVYQFKTMPTSYETMDLVRLGGFTFLWCLVASVLPAYRASRLDPLRSLVYE